VRKLKDAQRLFNMELSQAAELSSTGNRDIPIIDPRATVGYEAHWNNGSIYDKQYLPATDIVNSDGSTTSPLKGVIPRSEMSGTSAALLDIVNNYVKTSTGGQLADVTNVDMSGKAIRELVKRLNKNTRSVWLNIEASIVALGEVYKSIADDIYSVPRSKKTLAEDGSESRAMLMKVAMDDRGNITNSNNIRGMKFEVHVDVSPAYDSQQEEAVENGRSILAEINGTPMGEKYSPVIISTMIENFSGAGLEALKKFNRKEQLTMGIVEPKNQEEMEYLESLSQQTDPQAELVKAAAQQQMAEAENLKAQAVERISKTELNRANAVATIEDMKTNRIKALREAISRPA